MKKTLLISILIIGYLSATFAQTISKVTFKQVGNTVVVDYYFILPVDKKASVELFVSTNGGKDFQGPLKSVSGDIGEITKSGAKSIVWKVFEEYGSLSGDITFEVRAKLTNIPIKPKKFVIYNFSGSS